MRPSPRAPTPPRETANSTASAAAASGKRPVGDASPANTGKRPSASSRVAIRCTVRAKAPLGDEVPRADRRQHHERGAHRLANQRVGLQEQHRALGDETQGR